MRIAVIDGQGGGIGKVIVEKLKEGGLSNDVQVIGLGTNSAATISMLKAGADIGATGENAIIYNSHKVDIIIGPIGIIVANAMMGELNPKMAKAISESSAIKILIPLNKCSIEIVGVNEESLPQLIEKAAIKAKEYILNNNLKER